MIDKNYSQIIYNPVIFLLAIIVISVALSLSVQADISRSLAGLCLALLLMMAVAPNRLLSLDKATIVTKQYIFLTGMLLGGAFYFFIYGFEILNPTFIDWRMFNDPAQHFLGWHFFRSEPWHFPLGKIESYNYPVGTSIVYTDSIPLLAIPFKLFSPLLPMPFQYLGMWILSCYLLQGGFACLLLSRISKNLLVIALGASFFVLSPLLWRFVAHESLSAHWLILAAIYLYLQDYTQANRIFWSSLILISGMVHAYLLFMVLVVWLAYLGKNLLYRNDVVLLTMIKYIAITLVFLLIELWLIGNFISLSPTQFVAGGLGEFSMNLWAPFNPHLPFLSSLFLKEQPLLTEGQYEGYNYFGVGLILLLLIAIYEIAKHKEYIEKSRDLPLFLACLFLFCLALSNKVTLLDKVLFEVPLPYLFKGVVSIFRATGRMFWPVYYLVTLAVIAIIIRANTLKRAIIILLLASSIQYLDLSVLYKTLDLKTNVWSTPLKAKLWQHLAEKYDQIIFIPPVLDKIAPRGNTWIIFSLLASNHAMQINIASTARENYQARTVYEEDLLKQFYRGKLLSNALYVIVDNDFVFNDKVLARTAAKGVLDGYKIIAPGLAQNANYCCLEPWPATLDIIVDNKQISLTELLKNYSGEYSIILSVKGEARANMPAEFMAMMATKASDIKQLSVDGSYVAVIYNGEVLAERISNDSDLSLDLTLPGGYLTHIYNTDLEFGNNSNININGWNYSLNKNGINVVVLDNTSGEVRRYAFDTGNDEQATSEAQELSLSYSHYNEKLERAKQRLK